MALSASRERAAGSTGFLFDRYCFLLAACLLTVFGVVMIYSASSIDALAKYNDAGYYVVREIAFVIIGSLIAYFAYRVDYHVWARRLEAPLTAIIVILLIAVYTPIAGHEVNGSSRWIALGPFSLQPSEFAKPLVILIAADIIEGYLGDSTGNPRPYAKRFLIFVGLPMMLILGQPDKGTTVILAATIFVMLIIAGLRKRFVFPLVGVGLLAIVLLIVTGTYTGDRLDAFLNPWEDTTGNSYQIVQGLYAIARGGLTGVGLGLGRQKYAYIPYAHNDFIYAVIGEELGLVGATAVLLLFLALLYFGYRIARSAPDLSGKLLAAGCSSMLVIQMLINVCGVLKVIPLSGKPIPFISYGGSSIMASLIIAGLVLSVSKAGELHGGVAHDFVVHEGKPASRLVLMDGGASRTPDAIRASRRDEESAGGGRISYNANGTKRITLGPSASDRLRSRDSGRGDRR